MNGNNNRSSNKKNPTSTSKTQSFDGMVRPPCGLSSPADAENHLTVGCRRN